MANILVFSPHPDDAELVIGGMIKRLSATHNMYIAYLTNGENSCGVSVDVRKAECIEACDELAVTKSVFLDIKDLSVSRHSLAQKEKVIKIIRQSKPQLILSPHFSDSNVDHVESYWLVKYCRYIAGTGEGIEHLHPHFCKYIYYYGQNVAPNNNSLVYDVTDVYENKMRAIRCYKSQFGDDIRSVYTKEVLLERIISKDKYSGALFGVGYAEEVFYEGKIMLSSLFDVINTDL